MFKALFLFNLQVFALLRAVWARCLFKKAVYNGAPLSVWPDHLPAIERLEQAETKLNSVCNTMQVEGVEFSMLNSKDPSSEEPSSRC